MEIDQSSFTFWKNKQWAVPISISDFMDETLKARMDAAATEMARQMNIGLYGDRQPEKVLTRWQRLSGRLNRYLRQAGDAWLVLIGKADIGDW